MHRLRMNNNAKKIEYKKQIKQRKHITTHLHITPNTHQLQIRATLQSVKNQLANTHPETDKTHYSVRIHIETEKAWSIIL